MDESSNIERSSEVQSHQTTTNCNTLFHLKATDSITGNTRNEMSNHAVEENYHEHERDEEKEIAHGFSLNERTAACNDEDYSHSHERKSPSAAKHSLDGTECRTFTKLMYDPKLSQQKRREVTLEWQRKRRDDILDKIRQLEGDSAYSDSEPEEAEDFVKLIKRSEPIEESILLEERDEETVEQMDTASSLSSNKKKSHNNRKFHRRGKLGGHHKRQPPCRVMLSEWLIQKPEDFEENWLGVFCPVGKRCLVVASRGKTRVFSRADYCIGLYESLLPGGRKLNYRDPTRNLSRGVTILDCIWSDETHKFYVLDLVCWNSHSCNNCDTEYRQFFLNSKLSENPELMEATRLNPFPFIPLPKFPCDQMSEIVTASLPIFPEKVDGLLLFHKEAFYITETNPLCLWVYLTDIERRLNISISPELMSRQKKHKKRSESNKSMESDN